MRSTVLAMLAVLLTGWTASAQPADAAASAYLDRAALVAGSRAGLAVVLDIPPGLHSQSARPSDPAFIPFQVTVEPQPAFRASRPIYPPGEDKTYPLLGTLNVYEGRVIAYLTLEIPADAPTGPLVLRGSVGYQLCDDQYCFAPQEQSFEIATLVLAPGAAAEPRHAELFVDYVRRGLMALPLDASDPLEPPGASAAPPAVNATPSDTLLGWRFRISGVGAALLIALLAGFLLNLMPCVLPVLPLKAMGFYEAAGHARGRTVLFGLMFALGTVAIFALIGVIVLFSRSLLGEQFSWGQQFSSGWFVWPIAALLLLLGLALLLGYSIALPGSIYGLNFRHDTLSGNFMWGGLTAVLSTPCTAPLLPLLIGWAIGQPKAVGMLSMVCVGVGMAAPYVALSAFPQAARAMPRTGPFAELIKQMLGFLLLASGAFFAGARLFDGDGNLWLVAAVGVWASLFLVVRAAQLFRSSGALLGATAAAVLIAGGLFYAVAPPLSSGTRPTEEVWVDYSPQAFASARAGGRTVLVKFTADWCANCKVVEKTVFTDATVLADLRQRDVVAMKLDVDLAGWELHQSIAPGKGIPLTAIYLPGADRPVLLESMYSGADLLDALRSLDATATRGGPRPRG